MSRRKNDVLRGDDEDEEGREKSSRGQMKKFKFLCEDCGETHEGSPSFGYKWPHYFEVLNDDDRKNKAKIDFHKWLKTKGIQRIWSNP